MAPGGSKDKLIKELKTAAVNWGGNVRKGNSSREQVCTALYNNISTKQNKITSMHSYTERIQKYNISSD